MNSGCAFIEWTWEIREYRYYSDKENFITREGKIDHIAVGDDYIVIGFETLPEPYSCEGFAIKGENCDVIKQNGFLAQVSIGDTVTFISAPRYFGDGYNRPIVAISTSSRTYLEFDVGWNNLMKEY